MKKHIEQLRNNRSGYTFVELLVVIVILAVLVAASANYLFAQGGSKARDTERKNEVRQVAALVEQFVASYGEPPSPSVKNRKVRERVTDCESVNDYMELMTCFKTLKYIEGEGLLALAEDPKQGIARDDSGNLYEYLYGANNNGWKICTLLENQTDQDLNDNYNGSGEYGEEGGRTYCAVASNRKLSDIPSVTGGVGLDASSLAE